MMAARAGAASVTCIERIPEMAAVAESIVAANGFDQVITVLRTDSTALSELPGGTRADILLSEILDDGLLVRIQGSSMRVKRARCKSDAHTCCMRS